MVVLVAEDLIGPDLQSSILTFIPSNTGYRHPLAFGDVDFGGLWDLHSAVEQSESCLT